jgi:hypothetical protein
MGDCHLSNITKFGGKKKHYYGQCHFSSINPLARTTGASFCHLVTRKKKRNANLSKDLFSEIGPKSPQLKKK